MGADRRSGVFRGPRSPEATPADDHLVAIVARVPSAETEVYRDSAVNWLRFNHKDLFNAACYVGLCAVLLLAGWGVDHLFNVVFPGPKPVAECATVAKCNAEILATHLHVTGTTLIPQFHPPALTPPT